MPFDSLGMFHDGTTITGTGLTPVSTVRTGGSAVLDLRQSPAVGWAVAMVVMDEPTGTSPTIQVHVEDCPTVGGTYVERARSPALSGAAQRGTHIFRFSTATRFVRCRIVLTGTTPSYTRVHLFLIPHAFRVL